jgi:hypothetical protein
MQSIVNNTYFYNPENNFDEFINNNEELNIVEYPLLIGLDNNELYNIILGDTKINKDYNLAYFPIYLLNNNNKITNFKQCQIGIFEMPLNIYNDNFKFNVGDNADIIERFFELGEQSKYKFNRPILYGGGKDDDEMEKLALLVRQEDKSEEEEEEDEDDEDSNIIEDDEILDAKLAILNRVKPQYWLEQKQIKPRIEILYNDFNENLIRKLNYLNENTLIIEVPKNGDCFFEAICRAFLKSNRGYKIDFINLNNFDMSEKMRKQILPFITILNEGIMGKKWFWLDVNILRLLISIFIMEESLDAHFKVLEDIKPDLNILKTKKIEITKKLRQIIIDNASYFPEEAKPDEYNLGDDEMLKYLPFNDEKKEEIKADTNELRQILEEENRIRQNVSSYSSPDLPEYIKNNNNLRNFIRLSHNESPLEKWWAEDASISKTEELLNIKIIIINEYQLITSINQILEYYDTNISSSTKQQILDKIINENDKILDNIIQYIDDNNNIIREDVDYIILVHTEGGSHYELLEINSMTMFNYSNLPVNYKNLIKIQFINHNKLEIKDKINKENTGLNSFEVISDFIQEQLDDKILLKKQLINNILINYIPSMSGGKRSLKSSQTKKNKKNNANKKLKKIKNIN